jgi:hypothetical protein
MKEQLYKVTLFGGYCGLIAASSLAEAKKVAMSEQGSSNVQYVAPATREDLEWVKGMGGHIPKMKPTRPSEWAKEGVYVVEGFLPKPGMDIDYYDRDGCKRQGIIKSYDGETIVIDGLRTVIVEETFKVRHGR